MIKEIMIKETKINEKPIIDQLHLFYHVMLSGMPSQSNHEIYIENKLNYVKIKDINMLNGGGSDIKKKKKNTTIRFRSSQSSQSSTSVVHRIPG